MKKVANPPNEEIPMDYTVFFDKLIYLYGDQSQCIHIALYIASQVGASFLKV